MKCKKLGCSLMGHRRQKKKSKSLVRIGLISFSVFGVPSGNNQDFLHFIFHTSLLIVNFLTFLAR